MTEQEKSESFRLVSDLVLSDCRRIVRGVYNKADWPKNVPIPKSAKPVRIKPRVRKEDDLPDQLPVPEDAEIEEDKGNEPTTLKAMTPKEPGGSKK